MPNDVTEMINHLRVAGGDTTEVDGVAVVVARVHECDRSAKPCRVNATGTAYLHSSTHSSTPSVNVTRPDSVDLPMTPSSCAAAE